MRIELERTMEDLTNHRELTTASKRVNASAIRFCRVNNALRHAHYVTDS